MGEDLSQGKPVLPWLKIFLSDLEVITKSTTFFVGHKVNFYKFHLIARILRTLLHCQNMIRSQTSPIVPDEFIRRWLQSEISTDQKRQDLQSLSAECEPMHPKELQGFYYYSHSFPFLLFFSSFFFPFLFFFFFSSFHFCFFLSFLPFR